MVFHLLVRWSCNCYESGGWLCIKKWAGKRLQEWWCFPASYNMVSAVWLFYQIVSRLVCGLVALLCTVHYQWQVLWEKLPFGALTILCSKRLIECSTHGPMKFSGSPFSTATAQIRDFQGESHSWSPPERPPDLQAMATYATYLLLCCLALRNFQAVAIDGGDLAQPTLQHR